MKVLIVEDDQNKRKQIIDYIETIITNIKIISKYSYQSGLKAILEGGYDIVILDMSMPTFDITPQEPGGRPRPFAGKEILMQMSHRKVIIPVVVVTQFEIFGSSTNTVTLSQLDKELSLLYEGIYMGAIYYNASLDSWKNKLRILLENK